MKVLAIDTSSTLGGVAIMDSAAGLLLESRINVKAVAHSERLMAEVDGALAKCGIGLQQIDALVAAVGPGSFTGLRIGIGTIKGLAYATGLPVVGVSSLEAFAWGIGGAGSIVCTMFDARKSAVYAGAFRCSGDRLEQVLVEGAYPAGELAAMLFELDADVMLAGDGALSYRDVFADVLGRRAVFAPPHHMVSSPAALAHMGLLRAMRSEYTSGDALGPVYLRRAEAEVKLIEAGGSDNIPNS